MSFNGFCSNTLEFLIENRLNDSKSWFEEHKTEYNDFLLSPLKELVAELSSPILELDPLIGVTPAIGKTISRIYRDTRFSKDKSLFRENMWLVFIRDKRSCPEWPAFYFDISPMHFGYGMGYYATSKETLQLFREYIANNHPAFLQAFSCYGQQHTFQFTGEKYKKLQSAALPEPVKDWYVRKNINFDHTSTDLKPLFSKKLVGELVTGYRILQPIYAFLCDIQEQRIK
jgi:Uncharacterized conserved protein